MPSYVLRMGPHFNVTRPQAAEFKAAEMPMIAVPEMVPRSCRLETYDKIEIKPVTLPAGTELISYASPDSTFAVTKRLIDAAQDTILIGIYDFSAPHMKEVLLNALARGVSISLMLDIDTKKESDLFDDLVRMGVRGVPAPSCANDTVRYFSSSHEKVIIIDRTWCLVQSGNYSTNSIPFNVKDGGEEIGFRTGNRDMGLAIRSEDICSTFSNILEADMALVEGTPEMLRRPIEDQVFLIERAPLGPGKRFPSKSFMLDADLEVTPVLSPDNYMDVVPDLLAKAKTSIFIEQQYIKARQPLIRQLLTAMKEAQSKSPELDIRIILGKVFDTSKLPAEEANLAILANEFGLELGKHIRYINTDQFVHCHNKMIVIDGAGVLISSQNWSDSAVAKNREAGVWLKHGAIADYYTSIFEYDWSVAFNEPTTGTAAPEMVMPETLGAGGFIEVERADYQEV